MSAAIKEVVSIIESIAPLRDAYEWDNSGLQIKCAERVNNMLITLDVTPQTVAEAKENGCDMILSHHPLIFDEMKSVDIDAYTDSIVMQLIKNDISLYCAHTSFDRAQGGLNDELAQSLGLLDIETIQEQGEGVLRIGRLEKFLSAAELADRVKETLLCSHVCLTDVDPGKIEMVGVVGGSGGDFAAAAKVHGAQALITGEAKHSHHLEAKGLGILIVEAGHYDTEKLFSKVLLSGLQLRIDEVQLHLGLKLSKQSGAPYNVV